MNRVGVDTECTGLNVWTGDRPFAASACFESGETRYWEWVVDPITRQPRVDRRDAREIQAIVGDVGLEKDFWNFKYDRLMLRSIGMRCHVPSCNEVSFMARAVNNLEFAYKLKPLAKKYVEIDDDDEDELHKEVVRCRRIAKKLGWNLGGEVEQDYWLPFTLWALEPAVARQNKVKRDVCREYAVRDAQRTIVLGEFYRIGMRERNVVAQYRREMELLPITMEMEEKGVLVDPGRIAECRAECEAKIRDARARLDAAWPPGDFNVDSPKQVAGLLFGPSSVAGLPILKRTKTGQAKTDAEALAPYKSDPMVADVLSLRANGNAIKNFFGKYPRLAEPVSAGGRNLLLLHPGYRQWGTLTDRYACSEPNLQQVSDPDTTNSLAAEFVVDIRQVYVPAPGRVWYCPDYDQVEVIIFADVSGEPTMLEAIRRGDDIHGATAEKIWGGEDNPKAVDAAMLALETSDRGKAVASLQEHAWKICELEGSVGKKTTRKKSKSVTFTKVFGGGPTALMRWISVGYDEARRILNDYDDAFPTMVSRMKAIERRGRRDGYVTNPFGLRLEVDPWHAYRAVNHIVQSTAAVLMKMGMLKCHRYLREVGVDARILMTIHDELIFDFRREHAFKRVLRGIRDRMADSGGALTVRTPVSMDRVTERWSEKEKVEL